MTSVSGAVASAAMVSATARTIRQVRAAVVAHGRADSDEHDLAEQLGPTVVRGGEPQSARCDAACEQLFQTRLVDGRDAGGEPCDLGGVEVDAYDLVAHVGETNALYESDVAGADDGDFGHGSASLKDDSCRS